jgi:hypothetical protein
MWRGERQSDEGGPTRPDEGALVWPGAAACGSRSGEGWGSRGSESERGGGWYNALYLI